MTFDEVVARLHRRPRRRDRASSTRSRRSRAEQRAVWARDELLPLGALATRRAALMHELAAIDARIAPLRDRLRTDLDRRPALPGYDAAEARRARRRRR